MSVRAALLGLCAFAVVAACLLPLLWPAAELFGGSAAATFAVLADAGPWRLLAHSLGVTAGVLAVALAIGLPTALLVARTDAHGRGLALLIHAFPTFLPPLLPALGWFHLLGRQGLHGNEMTADLLFSQAGVVLVIGLALAPIVTALTTLALWNADPAQEEAARAAAPPLRVATRILLPAARPAILLAAVLVAALSLSEVAVPVFLRVRTYAAAVFTRLGGVDYAPAEALLLTLPVLAVALAVLALERRAAGERSFTVLGLRSFRSAPIPLRRWRAPATVWCWTVALISAAPLAALAWRAGPAGFTAIPAWIGQSIRNSLLPATAAATVIVLLGIVVGHGLARRQRGPAALDALALLAFLAPAALLGIGLIALWNRSSTDWVYGTWLIIALGYVGRYAVIGVRAFAVASAQASAEIEDAAQVFGAGYWRRLSRIVVPLHARAIVGAWLLALVFGVRDLDTAVIYYPPGREPLPVRIFALEANGPEAVVAALACVQVGVTAALVALAFPLLRGLKAK